MAETLKNISQKVEDFTKTEIKEGDLTKRIEEQTAKIPSVAFLNLAFGAIIVSAGLSIFSERKSLASFVGEWVPTFLLLGIYNKLVKIEGSDRFDPAHSRKSA